MGSRIQGTTTILDSETSSILNQIKLKEVFDFIDFFQKFSCFVSLGLLHVALSFCGRIMTYVAQHDQHSGYYQQHSTAIRGQEGIGLV